ncbi:hypothetical protein [Frankia sp. R82]|uniref:hypothetical protein n=1 Tax=Frankia sp. R82 TaxID=2950553 RepID=UPI0020439550|nr:hypothetical protein [Frankia sp. R82]MCM3884351.1 hypothetical protein [Frankia sp. R82]
MDGRESANAARLPAGRAPGGGTTPGGAAAPRTGTITDLVAAIRRDHAEQVAFHADTPPPVPGD